MFKKHFKIVFTMLLSFAFLIYILPVPVFAFGPASNDIYDGIDVSIYQGNIDFKKIKNDGIEVVYIRSSEGENFVDPNYERNYREAKENGLKVGFYHYVTARTEEEARRQAEFFVSTIGGKSPDCKLAMDFENFGNLTKSEVNKIGLAFLNRVKELSKKEVVLYSDAYAASFVWEGETTTFPLWIAQYEVNEPQNNGNWETWEGWQYSDKGEINGINTYVDRDKFTKEILLSDNSELPKPEKPEEPENPEEEPKTKTIIIKWGDTLSQLALDYHTTVEELVKLNNIANPNLIYAGCPLIVPNNESKKSDTQIYIVKKGDTLSEIARIFDTSVLQIAKDNNIKNVNLIFPGQKLVIRSNDNYDTNHIIYTIKKGDTLWSISRKYNTTIANLVMSNRIKNKNLIYAGQFLRINRNVKDLTNIK